MPILYHWLTSVWTTCMAKKWYCCLDMNSGYWQIPVSEEDKCRTAFITKYGLYQFVKLPFRLSGAQASLQRTMHLVLHRHFWKSVIIYVDDINVLDETLPETLDHLKIIFDAASGMGLNWSLGNAVYWERPHFWDVKSVKKGWRSPMSTSVQWSPGQSPRIARA